MTDEPYTRHIVPSAGLAISLPRDWHLQSDEAVQANRARVRDGFDQAALPVFAATKYAESRAGINPTVQILVRPMPEPRPPSAVMLLDLLAAPLAAVFQGFETLDPVRTVRMGAVETATAAYSYILGYLDGEAVRAATRLRVVPQDGVFVAVSISGPMDPGGTLDAEFEAIDASLWIKSGG